MKYPPLNIRLIPHPPLPEDCLYQIIMNGGDPHPIIGYTRARAWYEPPGMRRKFEDSWEKIERNDPCPCGSGRKAKKCCLTG